MAHGAAGELKIVPHKKRTLEGPDAEADLAQLQQRFRSVSRRQERQMFMRRLYHRGRWWVVIALYSAAFAWGLTIYTQWPLATSLMHLAASVSCDGARLAGLAPAREGYPGYWRHHDPDGDGIACD